MQPDLSDLYRFDCYRRLDGSVARAIPAKRNGTRFLAVPPNGWEPDVPADHTEFFECGKFYVNLNPIERQTWESILNGQTISDVARAEGVTRQAILSRIRGNSKGQGGMIAKNFWVLLWWEVRQRTGGERIGAFGGGR